MKKGIKKPLELLQKALSVDRTSTLSNQFIDDYIDTARFAEKHSYALNELGLNLNVNLNTIQ
jgi:hypothetical protein